MRADAHFESHRALRRNEGAPFDERPASGTGVTSRECAEKASSSSVEERYQTWRDCIERQRPQTVALPLGEFKAPTAGWIVISGRRGHYDFCDTTRAYNLATGAAFISDSCSGLALRGDGTVDVGATNSARAERTNAGRVPVENLREAVWMMLVRDEATALQLTARVLPVTRRLHPAGHGTGRTGGPVSRYHDVQHRPNTAHVVVDATHGRRVCRTADVARLLRRCRGSRRLLAHRRGGRFG